MKKTTYSILSKIPFIKYFVGKKYNAFYGLCSPFMDEFTKTQDYKILTSWMSKHPKEMLTADIAKKLLNRK